MAASRRVRKAVLPVAGLGTRMLPAAKTIPKEMLTVVDRPLIHWVVAEARAAGIEHFVLVTGRGKGAMEDYFDHHVELEATLRAKGKTAILDELLADLPKEGEVSYVRQMEPLGLGHAVWCARDIIGDEPFAVLLPDMITLPGQRGGRCLAQCIETYGRHGGNVIAVEEVPMDQTHQYGIVSIGADKGSEFEITGMVEKPPQGTAPSTSMISGRYILDPSVFDVLAHGEKGAGGEIQLTDAMKKMLGAQPFHGTRFDGRTYDTGSKLGFLAANAAVAMARPELAEGFREELRRIVGTL